MALVRKGRNGGASRGARKTVGGLLKECGVMSRPMETKAIADRAVSVIVLCDPVPFDEKVLGTISHVTMGIEDDLLQKIKELQEENARLQSLSLIDDLTGLGNSRFFWMQLETEIARTKRTGLCCTLMMIDLDNFKFLNDTFGHLEGDGFLRGFGAILRENSRSTDTACRYGGDEFALIMPATTVADALRTGERLTSRVTDVPQKGDPPISLSIGIAEYTSFSSCGMNEFVQSADAALYEAKEEGKNRICVDKGSTQTDLENNEVSRDEKDALFTNYE
jgi:diguanylate cyclase (GGDEF)-like protein